MSSELGILTLFGSFWFVCGVAAWISYKRSTR